MIGEHKKLISDDHFIFYNNLISTDVALMHSGDNLISEGDDEAINVDIYGIKPDLIWKYRPKLVILVAMAMQGILIFCSCHMLN